MKTGDTTYTPLLAGTRALLRGTGAVLRGTRAILRGTRAMLRDAATVVTHTRSMFRGNVHPDVANQMPVALTVKVKGADFSGEGKIKEGVQLKITASCSEVEEF